MPTSLQFSHEFPFSAARYVDVFFDPSFIESLARDQPDLDEYRIEVLENTDDRLLRTIKVAPRIQLPRSVQLVLRGRRISWLETTSHRRDSDTLHWSILTNVLTEKVQIGGTYVLEDLGAGRCRRTVLGQIAVRSYAFGATIEERIAQQIQDSFTAGRPRMIAYAAGER